MNVKELKCIDFKVFSDNTVLVVCEGCNTSLTFKVKKLTTKAVMTPAMKEFLYEHETCIDVKH